LRSLWRGAIIGTQEADPEFDHIDREGKWRDWAALGALELDPICRIEKTMDPAIQALPKGTDQHSKEFRELMECRHGAMRIADEDLEITLTGARLVEKCRHP
jgi:hypothetical protein